MIPKASRLEILRNIFTRVRFTRFEIKLIQNNWVTADADCLYTTFDFTGDPNWTPMHVPDFLSMPNYTAWAITSGINDHSEAEIDSPLADFVAAIVPEPYHIYGFAIIYSPDDDSSTHLLYGFARFTDPIPVAAVGDHAKFYVNVYADNFVPLGHL